MMLRLEPAIVARLQHGTDERYTLAAEDLPALAHVLRAAVQGPQAVPELVRALALSVALRGELASPAAGERVLELLRSDPDALALIRERIIRDGAIDEVRKFRETEDRKVTLAAPRFDSREPKPEGVPLSKFLDPNGGRVPRVVRPKSEEDRALCSRR